MIWPLFGKYTKAKPKEIGLQKTKRVGRLENLFCFFKIIFVWRVLFSLTIALFSIAHSIKIKTDRTLLFMAKRLKFSLHTNKNISNCTQILGSFRLPEKHYLFYLTQ